MSIRSFFVPTILIMTSDIYNSAAPMGLIVIESLCYRGSAFGSTPAYSLLSPTGLGTP